MPCTNCTAFSIECKIPTPKRQRVQKRSKDGGYVSPPLIPFCLGITSSDIVHFRSSFKNETQDTVSPSSSAPGESTQQNNGMSAREKIIVYNNSQDGTPSSADKKASVAAAAKFRASTAVDRVETLFMDCGTFSTGKEITSSLLGFFFFNVTNVINPSFSRC